MCVCVCVSVCLLVHVISKLRAVVCQCVCLCHRHLCVYIIGCRNIPPQCLHMLTSKENVGLYRKKIALDILDLRMSWLTNYFVYSDTDYLVSVPPSGSPAAVIRFPLNHRFLQAQRATWNVGDLRDHPHSAFLRYPSRIKGFWAMLFISVRWRRSRPLTVDDRYALRFIIIRVSWSSSFFFH